MHRPSLISSWLQSYRILTLTLTCVSVVVVLFQSRSYCSWRFFFFFFSFFFPFASPQHLLFWPFHYWEPLLVFCDAIFPWFSSSLKATHSFLKIFLKFIYAFSHAGSKLQQVGFFSCGLGTLSCSTWDLAPCRD